MLRIRLSRVGRKNQTFFKIVVMPKSGPPKGGDFRDEIGTHDPVNKETVIDSEKARGWLAKGAQPSDTVYNLFVKHGVIAGRKREVHDKDPVEPKEEKPKKDKKEDTEKVKEEEKKEDTEEVKEEEKKEDTEEVKEEEKKEDTEEVKEEDPEGEQAPVGAGEEKKGLEDLDLTTRIINALEDEGIDTVEKLKSKSEKDLSEIKGLGKKSIEKIQKEIK